MSKVTFNSSQKKQFIAVAIHGAALLLFVSFPWALDLDIPIGSVATLLLLIGTVVIGASCLYFLKLLKPQGAFCPSCNADLFGVIFVAQKEGVTINHCISCGEPIEI